MSIEFIAEADFAAQGERCIQVVEAAGFPQPADPAQADIFARHEGLVGHDQEALAIARIAIVGAGGLGGWIALGLARAGARQLTIIDPDRFDRTNASRQFMFADDLREPKACALARNVAPHMIAGGNIVAIPLAFERAIEMLPIPMDILVVGVDNNRCRWITASMARRLRIPAVFSMLSADGTRLQLFAQGAETDDGCLWCALPNLDPEAAAPCASALISGPLTAAGYATYLAHRALMARSKEWHWNWRTIDLNGAEGDSIGAVRQRRHCALCGTLAVKE